MIIQARTVVDGQVAVPAPRAPLARPGAAASPVAGPSAVEHRPEDHPEVVVARLESQAAVVAWVGRLVLLLALGLAALVVLL